MRVIFALLFSKTLAFLNNRIKYQTACYSPVYSQQGSENAPIKRRNYFPIRKRGYYERLLAQLNSRKSREQEKKGIEKIEESDGEEPRRKWVIWIKPDKQYNKEPDPEPENFNDEDDEDDYDDDDDDEDNLGQDEDDEIKNERPSYAESPSKTNRGFGSWGGGNDKKSPKKSDNFEIVTNSPVTFRDVGGYDNIKKELLQCTDLLANFTKYSKYNVRIPKGLILEGPPGNGKTLLARAFAGECGKNVSFIAVSGSQFQEKYVGVGSSRIRELFDLARKNTPCIIFIDEIDALGKQRSSDGETSSSERDSTLNELLSQMDGFRHSDGIFIIASTNRADILDTALTRPGRIDKRIFIGQPDAKTRESILHIHLQGKPCSSEINLLDLVSASSGFSGAQLENWLNEAMLNALRDNRELFSQSDLDESINRVMVGWQPTPHEFQDDMLNRIAIHEMGHAIIGMKCRHHAKVVKVAIQLHSPTSPGITQFESNVHNIYTRDALFEHLMILLGGQLAESNVFSISTTTGVSDDLQKVYELAEKMILYYGMGTRVVYPKNSEKYKEIVDEEIMNLIQNAYKSADFLIKQNLEAIIRGSSLLVEKQVLKAEEIDNLMQSNFIVG